MCAAMLALSACGPVTRPPTAPTGGSSSGGEETSGTSSSFSVGQRVAAKWTDGKYYLATIKTADGDDYGVHYADGDKGVVHGKDMHAIAPPGTLQVGDHVMAVWKGAQMYPGVITSMSGGKALVKWDDGDTPLAVPEDRIARLGGGATSKSSMSQSPGLNPSGTGQDRTLQVGDRVAAKWKDGNYWYAAIGGIEGDSYRIHYADGDKLTVKHDDVIPVAPRGTLKVGDHVVAVWKGAKMYPGVITSVGADTATVKWDDGDTPLAVPLDQIALH